MAGKPVLNTHNTEQLRRIFTALEQCQNPRKILILGSAFVDVVLKVEALPQSGADITGQMKKTQVGGCSFNVADVLYKLQIPFDHLMPVGEGLAATIITQEFERRGYPVFNVPGIGDNGWCLSLVEPEGERTFISMSGVEQKFDEAWFDNLDLGSYDYIYLSGYQAEGDNGRTILKALTKHDLKAIVLFDPGPRAPYISDEVLKELEARHCLYDLNEAEALHLSGAASVKEAVKVLSARCGGPAVVTCGKEGTVAGDLKEISEIAGFSVKVADTIGSGDSHSGALLAALCCDLKLNDACSFANYIAATVTARTGAATAPTRDEIKEHLFT